MGGGESSTINGSESGGVHNKQLKLRVLKTAKEFLFQGKDGGQKKASIVTIQRLSAEEGRGGVAISRVGIHANITFFPKTIRSQGRAKKRTGVLPLSSRPLKRGAN